MQNFSDIVEECWFPLSNRHDSNRLLVRPNPILQTSSTDAHIAGHPRDSLPGKDTSNSLSPGLVIILASHSRYLT